MDLAAAFTKTAAPTHYLHHQYREEQSGRWVLVWRKIGGDPFRDWPEDRYVYANHPERKLGRTRRFSKGNR